MRSGLVLWFVLLLAAGEASAKQVIMDPHLTAGQLLDRLKDTDAADFTLWTVYAAGILAGLDAGNVAAHTDRGGAFYCPPSPPPSTYDTVVRVLKETIEHLPEARDKAAEWVLMIGIRVVYPC